MAEPIPPVTLPPAEDAMAEATWLRHALQTWLDSEFLPEAVNTVIAERAAQVFLRQRLEGEDDVGSLLIAILTEMRAFDFSQSFYSEFAVANAISDLLLRRLDIEGCISCG